MSIARATAGPSALKRAKVYLMPYGRLGADGQLLEMTSRRANQAPHVVSSRQHGAGLEDSTQFRVLA